MTSKTKNVEKSVKTPQKILQHEILDTCLFQAICTKGTSIKTLSETIKEVLPEATVLIKRYDNDNDMEDSDVSVKSGKKTKSDDDSTTKNKGVFKISAMNQASTVLVSVEITQFDFFYLSKKSLKIGLDMVSFYRYIKGITPADTLVLYLDKNNENQLGIKIYGKDQKERVNSYLNLLDLKDIIYQVPKAEFTSIIMMPATAFQKICKDMVAPHIDKIDIINYGNQISFMCKSETGTQELVISCENTENETSCINTKDTNDIIQGTYELKNLILLTKCTSLCDNIKIYMKNDHPLYIVYEIPNLGKVIWVTAQLSS